MDVTKLKDIELGKEFFCHHGCKSQRGLGGLAPPGISTGGAGNGPSTQEKQGLSPPTFRNMRGLPGLLLLLTLPLSFPTTEIVNCKL